MTDRRVDVLIDLARASDDLREVAALSREVRALGDACAVSRFDREVTGGGDYSGDSRCTPRAVIVRFTP